MLGLTTMNWPPICRKSPHRKVNTDENLQIATDYQIKATDRDAVQISQPVEKSWKIRKDQLTP
jgi:hypothetical protein